MSNLSPLAHTHNFNDLDNALAPQTEGLRLNTSSIIRMINWSQAST